MKNIVFMISLFFYSSLAFAQPSPSSRALTATDIYQSNGNQLVWFDKYGLTIQAVSFSLLMDDLGVDIAKFLSSEQTDTQLLMTYEKDQAYTRAAVYFLNTVNASNGGVDLFTEIHFIDMAKKNSFSSFISSLSPPYDEVSRLREMIRHYKTLARKPWPGIEGMTFRLGQSNNNILQLRQRLVELGDIDPPESSQPSQPSQHRAAIYDPSLIEGIKNFQKRHGIAENGKLDEVTINLLNVLPRKRVELMQLNLWRWFKLPNELPSRYLRINIPSFELKLLENEHKVLTMKVIVGKPKTPTPTMTTTLTQITVNPSWTPPWSIVSKELIPLNDKQPGYLSHQDFKLRRLDDFSLIALDKINSKKLASLLTNHQLIQLPGAKNALGRYRFRIPNNSAIYLHDTPTKSFFSYPNRAMSHGCIRLENPQGLSDYLMQGDNRMSKLRRAVNEKSTQSYKVGQPLPVFITYHTTWVDERGKLQLRDDIYRRDSEG
ncbi:L,D-transpeptidase family protein [Shewanella sp. UCD-KL12]|uniref:L,D-transpeptidase family protein n=1 Tax=Shewanella sp. UCD-KL12 TaxID=1917163 RepID=UPI0015C2D9A5|nr:L,D-transpeptidase family protein [Shewanella sp. UCD-KL12]